LPVFPPVTCRHKWVIRPVLPRQPASRPQLLRRSFIDPTIRTPMFRTGTSRSSASLPKDLILDLGYSGNHSVGLWGERRSESGATKPSRSEPGSERASARPGLPEHRLQLRCRPSLPMKPCRFKIEKRYSHGLTFLNSFHLVQGDRRRLRRAGSRERGSAGRQPFRLGGWQRALGL